MIKKKPKSGFNFSNTVFGRKNSMRSYVILAFSMLLFGSSSLCPQEPSKVSVDPLTVRNAHSMVYHVQEASIYLFAGADEREVKSDLWVLESANWQKVSVENAPQPRTFAAMAYDPQENRILLFGGSKVLFGKEASSKNLYNDTWQFKDGSWQKIPTENAPTVRAEASMVYDVERQRMVLFGGYTIQEGNYIKLGDTWEFYEDNWHLASENGPSARHGVVMAYDPEIKSVTLFGGSTVDKQYGPLKGETWIWKGDSWDKLAVEQPPGMFNACMAYDTDQKRLLRFGGWNGKSRTDETWAFQNNTWTPLQTETGPSPRNHSGMVYDEKNKRMLLFGGHDGKNVFGDMWEFSNNAWQNITTTKPLKRVKNGH
ncbi:Kelch repeat-containing protein [Spongiimicrobium sp. 2-473A-2-J]|uniref:Kelch repeat-containing protein n=1 Tax=Eudoraea algarum TaxID=3417568 RepID=UPI003D360A85